MSCFVPIDKRHLQWHLIVMRFIDGRRGPIERAQWLNDERNGPTEGGHWLRWGKTGDFPSLCRADYICPSHDQDRSYFDIDPQWLNAA